MVDFVSLDNLDWNQECRKADEAERRDAVGYVRRLVRRSSAGCMLLGDGVSDDDESKTEGDGRLDKRGASGTEGTMLKTTDFDPGSSSNSCKTSVYNQSCRCL